MSYKYPFISGVSLASYKRLNNGEVEIFFECSECEPPIVGVLNGEDGEQHNDSTEEMQHEVIYN